MRSLLPLVVLAVGCSCGGSPAAGATHAAPATGGAAEPAAPASPGTYSVHEWGLVRAGAGDTLAVGAMGPPAPPLELMAVEKPVLYFHLEGDGPLELASVTVEALGGGIVEHWPHTDAPALAATIAWTDRRLERATCPLVPPTATDPPCRDLASGEACESLALERAVTSDSACVRAPGGGGSPLLFYRSTSSALTAPLVASRRGGDLEVRNEGELSIPGRVVRFEREGSVVRVAVSDAPAPHASLVVGAATGGPELARAAVTESLLGLGLTASEAAAFLASWDAAFFGAAPSETPPVEGERMAMEESLPPETSILYFLPPADVERIARLSFEPPPTEVRRAMAVWTALP